MQNYIAGKWEESSSRQVTPIHNPATGQVIAEMPFSTREEVERALSAARAAFPAWRETPPVERARCLLCLRILMEEHWDELAQVITLENGKTLSEARGEVLRSMENVEVAAGIPSLMMGHNLEDIARGIDEAAVRQPIGVFCVVAPFNFPNMVPFWFLPYAVATGNTYIVKPSHRTPISWNRMMPLVEKAGFPDGVVNLVNGFRDVVDALLESPNLAGLSFVGSTPVAKYIYQKGTSRGKRVQAQAGAKNFLVVMPDCSLDETVSNIMGSAFGNAGQRCLAGAIAVGVGGIYEELRDALVEAARNIVVGNGIDEGVDMGPVISRASKERIEGYIAGAEHDGAKILLDGRGIEVAGYREGYFVGPTIIDQVWPEMAVAQEEVFGPVLSMMRAKDLREALELMEGVAYGNAGSIFTSSGRAAREFVYRAPVGNIGINIGVAAPMAFFHFGGMRESFFGDLHGQGRDAIEFFTEKKVVISRWW